MRGVRQAVPAAAHPAVAAAAAINCQTSLTTLDTAARYRNAMRARQPRTTLFKQRTAVLLGATTCCILLFGPGSLPTTQRQARSA